MLRYLRLYGSFVRFSVSKSLQFRFDFFFRVFMDMLWYVQYLLFFDVLYGQSGTIGGWDRHQGYVFTGALFVLDAMQMTFFSNNMWQLPDAVNKGDIDYHLLRPVSSLFMLTCRDFAVNSALNLLMAIGVLLHALLTYPHPLPALNVLVFVPFLLLGLFIHLFLGILFLLPVFWIHSGSGLRDLLWTMDPANARPAGIWKGWARRMLTTVLPFAIIVSFPVRVLFEGPQPEILLHMLAVAACLGVTVAFLWRRGLRAYSSASS